MVCAHRVGLLVKFQIFQSSFVIFSKASSFLSLCSMVFLPWQACSMPEEGEGGLPVEVAFHLYGPFRWLLSSPSGLAIQAIRVMHEAKFVDWEARMLGKRKRKEAAKNAASLSSTAWFFPQVMQSFWSLVRVDSCNQSWPLTSKSPDLGRDPKAMIITSIITCCSACWRVTKVGKIKRTSVCFDMHQQICGDWIHLVYVMWCDINMLWNDLNRTW